eukprot:540722_1
MDGIFSVNNYNNYNWEYDRTRDQRAKKYRKSLCMLFSIFIPLGSIFVNVFHNQMILFWIGICCFGICPSFTIIYIIWYSICSKHQLIHMKNELIINGIKVEAEQNFNKEYRYLIDGFIRIYFINLTSNYKHKYFTKDLIQIINSYVSYGFDISPEQFKNIIQHNGILINGEYNQNCTLTVGCLSGFTSGINVFKIKCINANSTDAIGVISNVNLCYDIFELHKKNDTVYSHAFYYKNSEGICYSGESKYLQSLYRKTYGSKVVSWITNAIITVTVDCEEWKVHFSIKDPKTQDVINTSMNLIVNKTYYPVISVSTQKSKYLLLKKYILTQ